MSSIAKLQYISLCSKVTQELENHIGIRDKTLAEFVIHLAKDSKTEREFNQKLEENEAEFTFALASSIYQMVKKMMPKESLEDPTLKDYSKIQEDQQQKPEESFEESAERAMNNPTLLAAKFPALAIPNKNVEELDLDLGIEEKPVAKESETAKKKDVKSISRSKSKSRSRSRSHKHKKKKEKSKKKRRHSSSSSRSRSKSKSRSSSGGARRRRRHHSRSNDRQKHKYTEPEVGKIYDGFVTKVMDYGCFVSLQGFKDRTEGLVHVSNIKNERISSPADHVKQGQKIKIKVLTINGKKISLSIKDVDQETGEEVQQKSRDYRPRKDYSRVEERKVGGGEERHEMYGTITGIKVDVDEETNKATKRIGSPDLWELSRLKYFGKGNQLPKEIRELEEVTAAEDVEEIDIELKEEEPLFLRGQTTKAGVSLSPVKVVKNPEGSMQREVLNAMQAAKERRDLREQQQRSLMETLPKEFNKYWDDPSAAPGTRTLVSSLKGIAQQEVESSEQRRENYVKSFTPGAKRAQMAIKDQRKTLPIYEYKDELLKAIAENKVLIVIGETGSGKTTQITQYLYEHGYCKRGKKIGCTQPRRVAAMSVAKRVAEEIGVKLGDEVGYSIRFEDHTSPKTLIKYMTEGMLLREALVDKDISAYSVIVLDEAHERNISMDVLFGLMKQMIQRRDDLRLIVTSATLDAEKFSSYFFNCNIFRIPGRTFPVDILYTKEPEQDYLEAALITIMQIHLTEPPGDILLFLTGQEEIDTACQILNDRMKKLGDEAPELIVLPIYSALPSELQSRIFEPAPLGTRKCVIATNIAEASLTIDGIYYVVDPGFAKIKAYNSKMGMDSLVVAPISQASARQRAGRAGRTGPGKCFRLYTEQAFKNEMLPVTVPEIQRTNLANTVLVLKAMGINDLINFDFMDPPPVQTLIAALEHLYALSGLDEEGLLTRLGRKMAEFPLEPNLSKMLLTSVDLGCSDEIITIVAMLTVQNIFFRPKDKQNIADEKRSHFFHPDGDHLTLLNVYEAWQANNYSPAWCVENFVQLRIMRRAQDVRKQIKTIMDRYKLPISSCQKDYRRIRKAICAGFFDHASRKDPQEGYKTLLDSHQTYIHPSSSLFNKGPEWVVYHELVMTSKEYMREVCTIDPRWLVEVAPNFFKVADVSQLSKRKRTEKLEPLQSKYEDKDAWRLSRRKG